MDQAIILLKELQDWKEISNIAHKACQLFQEHGSPDMAALLLDKSAKMIEPHLPEYASKTGRAKHPSSQAGLDDYLSSWEGIRFPTSKLIVQID